MKRRDGRDIAERPAEALAFESRRRRVLQGMVAAGTLVLPRFDAAAQTGVPGRGLSAPAAARSDGGALTQLPRQALVIGNSRYKETPLRNPANDASAMAGELRRMGFEVALLLDAGREQMQNAILAYGGEVAKRSAIGLFYFAGHGVQLAWRNYLIPVDAVVDNPDDVRERTVALNTLLQGLTRAKNPMNVIILDACRDNPFGTRVRTDQKGLSQFDAPPGSLLAYATSPGNTASDGEGANGLYTENLLREMRVPEAKIEDIFKRVRLHVRRRTNGQQIPWESTSLEEDFYFVAPGSPPPAEDEAERERKRREEQALREKRRAEEEAERKRKQEQAVREVRLAAEEAERKRQQELAALEQRRIADEAERSRKRELALKEAQRVAEEAERKRREEQALLEARRAEEEAARKYQQELALREKRRAEEEAERKRREEQALLEARRAQEEAERRQKQELALLEKQRAQEEAERRRKPQPAPAAKPDAALAERQFEEELAIWERIKSSTEPGPLEEYLLRYPSGRFSELAQFQLDRVLAKLGEKKIEIASSEGNPFTKGTARIDTNFKVGDRYSYREIDLYTRIEARTFTNRVTEITDNEVIFNNGRLVTDLFGNTVKLPNGNRFTGAQFFIPEYSVGKRWTTRFKRTQPDGQTADVDYEFRVVTREQVTVPAGTFNAYRVEGQGWTAATGTGAFAAAGTISLQNTYWIAPGIRRAIANEIIRKHSRGRVLSSERQELTAYTQG